MVAVQEEMRAQVLQTNGEATLHRSAGTSEKITKLLIFNGEGINFNCTQEKGTSKGVQGETKDSTTMHRHNYLNTLLHFLYGKKTFNFHPQGNFLLLLSIF